MRVAICGLGRMGAAMAETVAAAGYQTTAWNRTPRRAESLASKGIRVASTPAGAVATADLVLLVVWDARSCEDVLFGRDGIAVGARSERRTLVANVTTIEPNASLSLAKRATDAGLRYLETPVLGSVPKVRAGTLTVLAGGSADDVAAAEPVLRLFAHAGSVLRTGEVGTATAAKLVVNATLGIAVAGLHDAVRLAEALGVDRAVTLQALASGPLGGFVAGKANRLELERYDEADFTLAGLAKDLRLAADAAAAASQAAAASGGGSGAGGGVGERARAVGPGVRAARAVGPVVQASREVVDLVAGEVGSERDIAAAGRSASNLES